LGELNLPTVPLEQPYPAKVAEQKSSLRSSQTLDKYLVPKSLTSNDGDLVASILSSSFKPKGSLSSRDIKVKGLFQY